MKTCSKCLRALPYDSFHRRKGTADGRAGRCKECSLAYTRSWHERNPQKQQEYARRWRQKDPIRAREHYLRNTYGLSLEQYSALHVAQGGACAVCGAAPALLCVDHDHQCCPGARSCGRCVRGLLCKECNRADGALRSDAARARALAAYIERWSA